MYLFAHDMQLGQTWFLQMRISPKKWAIRCSKGLTHIKDKTQTKPDRAC